MDFKLTALTLAIVTGLAAPALAERPFHGDDARGPGMGKRPSFSELDANGDGSLTAEELQAHGQARFDAADTDGNGELTPDEVKAVAMAQIEEQMARRSRVMVARLDTDGNGAVSAEEMQDRGGDRGGDRMFSRLDRDGDGSVSADEYSARRDHGPKGGKGERKDEAGKWHKGHGHHDADDK